MTSSLRILCAAVAFATLLSPAQALAWGDEGHMLIGTIAYRLLRADVRTRVDAMLAADTDPTTAHDFVSETVWADKYRDTARRSGASSGTEKWHFTNIELSDSSLDRACFGHPPLPAGTPASAGPAHACSVDKIEQFVAELSNPATSPTERLLALKFTLHLVGDLHQPLHSADNRDGGGNGIYVMAAGGYVPIKLHAYWDTEVIKAMDPAARFKFGPRLVRAAAEHFSFGKLAGDIAADIPAHQAQWLAGRPADWALDAFVKARDVAYRVGPQSGTSREGKPVYTIDAAYESAATATAREQIAKAALRLAALLNGALGQ